MYTFNVGREKVTWESLKTTLMHALHIFRGVGDMCVPHAIHGKQTGIEKMRALVFMNLNFVQNHKHSINVQGYSLKMFFFTA